MKQKFNEPSCPQGRAPIRPELLAAKMAAIRNYEYPELLDQLSVNPRLAEILWFIQAMSLRPGGLLKFVEDLLAEFPKWLGTPRMIEAAGRSYTLEDKLAIRDEMPSHCQPVAEQENVFAGILLDSTPDEVPKMQFRDRKALEAGLKQMNADSCREICRQAALETLPAYFTALCTEKSAGFVEPKSFMGPKVWFFNDILGAMSQFMDRGALKVKQRLAMTEVAKEIFDACDYAKNEKRTAHVWGSSRFGKSEAGKILAEMYPGSWRHFEVPWDNSMPSLLKRMAESLGMDCSYGSDTTRLKERVLYVLAHGGLGFIIDQAHWLVPKNENAVTGPNRLNLVQSEIMERHVPLVLISTTEAKRDKSGKELKGKAGNVIMEDMLKRDLERFRQKTGYGAEQFNGRIYKRVPLPESLSEADLVAVVRIHFPELSDNALGYIANEARLSETYLQTVEAIASNARHLSRGHGGRVTSKDIHAAVLKVLDRSTTEPTSGAKQEPITKEPLHGALSPVARGIQPVGIGIARAQLLDSGAVRGAGTQRVEADLVPVEA